MKTMIAAAMTAACLAGPVAAQAQTFSFTTLDNPADPTFNQLLGINDAGIIAGYFGSGAVGHPNKGYTVAPPYTSFTSDNLPGSVQTQATGINNHNITTGFWSDTNLGTGDNNFGFIRLPHRHGSFEYVSVNDPLVGGAPFVDQVLGINNGTTPLVSTTTPTASPTDSPIWWPTTPSRRSPSATRRPRRPPESTTTA